ncbi:hypothetical protein LV82_02435 [Albidovulum inexpectatum]|uniref:Sensory transduction regulator n=1 Tax=Albidovulum inexpectatum TaxID=196587 RepID=A0A2S5JES0_9RHOB|nr:YbjN domain-containing protein [Albidovulum inexpectatum]PPB79878.1 hypothetical protein LV82_02435 [Albidovulum inexpectatum]
MAYCEDFLQGEELHPIDIVEAVAENHEWDFDRIAEDQIAMAVEGQWRTYSVTLAWSAQDETLRLICSFDMDPPQDRIGALYETLNHANDRVWAGAFAFWPEQRLMVWRYGLILSGGQFASPEQVDTMIAEAVEAAERFYPAFQLACWGGESPVQAMQVAIAGAMGHA